MRGGSGEVPTMVTVPASTSLNIMTADDSMSDDVFEVEDDASMAISNCLTPGSISQPLTTTPSPTGYPDYKPPAEVFAENYGYPTRNFDNVRSCLKRTNEEDSGLTHKNKVVVVDDTSVKLQIWDTAGQERFRSVTHAYYRDAHALLLLYDVTNKTSYDNIRAWLSEIREHANEDVVIMLLGNKSDCGPERVVKREDGERLAQEYKVPFMETSAKTGLNVELAFLAVARDLKAKKSSNPDDTKFNVQDYVRQQSQRTSCFTSNCLTT
ncbi:ras-related protein Rab-37-like isoform X3 [Ceratina calcarata]|uniref:Ras-related protein Rab-37-like isoform X3 n=1 Tax=Ceratina calcarata TaxID=156304 RepID=A0AAJ7S399_9HYME|nr:ras-related protein Rab-37-like isoform X3 [Ceratina calcarata]